MNVRWDYDFGTLTEEAARRAELESLVDAWWTAFRKRANDLSDLFGKRSEWDLPAWMAETLRAIDPALMWEFGPAVKSEGHRLVITPESRRDLRPLVRHILRVAPEIEGWEFYDHRLAESLEMARLTVEARCASPCQLTEVAVTVSEDNRIALRFSGPDVRNNDSGAEGEAFVLAETLLGEEVLDCWIGEISVHPRPKRGFLRLVGKGQPEPNSVPMEQLKRRVDAAIDSVLETLTDKSTESETATWSLLELKPEDKDDYPQQADLFVAKTPNLDLWRATRADGFRDKRFSRHGETFCYLKLDGSAGLDEEKFADKGELEDAIDALLRPAGWGCQIGGGTGLKYSYIEMALTDCAKALPAIRQRMAEGNIPKRSWILFHDCERATEWIGVYDDSPAPP
jgi:hypothetical protein